VSPSRTASLVAAYRAAATALGEAGCQDPYAKGLTDADGVALAERLLSVNPHMRLWIAVRTAFIDAAVTRLTEERGQLVILGAGFDTRAARLAKPGLRAFEVDTDATQATKIARARRVPGYPVDAATYVACDFERDDFVERLLREGFDPQAPAVLVWEGVTHYLTESAVRGTLSRIATALHPRTRVLFDYVGKKLVEGRSRDPSDARTLDLVRDVGEPFVFGTDDVIGLLHEVGLRSAKAVTFDDACLALTGTYDRERRFKFQGIAEAGVEDE
jgi:methyltransferase (TIGR00027 family)